MTRYYETPVGDVDGVNTAFKTSVDYKPGSIRLWEPVLQDPSCVTELGGKDFELPFAPCKGDFIMVTYIGVI